MASGGDSENQHLSHLYECLAVAVDHLKDWLGIISWHRDRAEGGAGGALAPPLLCKKKNKLNKK